MVSLMRDRTQALAQLEKSMGREKATRKVNKNLNKNFIVFLKKKKKTEIGLPWVIETPRSQKHYKSLHLFSDSAAQPSLSSQKRVKLSWRTGESSTQWHRAGGGACLLLQKRQKALQKALLLKNSKPWHSRGHRRKTLVAGKGKWKTPFSQGKCQDYEIYIER